MTKHKKTGIVKILSGELYNLLIDGWAMLDNNQSVLLTIQVARTNDVYVSALQRQGDTCDETLWYITRYALRHPQPLHWYMWWLPVPELWQYMHIYIYIYIYICIYNITYLVAFYRNCGLAAVKQTTVLSLTSESPYLERRHLYWNGALILMGYCTKCVASYMCGFWVPSYFCRHWSVSG